MLPDEYVTLDIESTVYPDGDPNPYLPGNKPYLLGIAVGMNYPTVSKVSLTGGRIFLPSFKVLIGHNIKFDLAHMREGFCTYPGPTPLLDYIQKEAVVWDTALCHYLMTGHKDKFPSLEECCAAAGIMCSKTIDLGEELPKYGYDITKIPDLENYLKNDVEMTRLLFLWQQEQPHVKENMKWYLSMMQALLATFEIERNGISVNPLCLSGKAKHIYEELECLDNDLKALICDLYGSDIAREFNLDSQHHLSALLFGGAFKWTKRERNGVFASGKKAGEPKYKLEDVTTFLPRKESPRPSYEQRKGSPGVYLVSEDVLQDLLSYTTEPFVNDFVRTLLKYRAFSKLQNTYVKNLTKYAIVDEKGNYLIHPNINMTSTGTGRTSATKPNMQNNPTNDPMHMKEVFESRFKKEEGVMLEIDFKQIEVIALAHLSGDPALCADILADRDIHTETGKEVYGHKLTKEQRRAVKGVNFGMIYGGSAETLAVEVGVPKAIVSGIIKAFYARYSKTKDYFAEVFTNVDCELHKSRIGAGYTDTPIGKVSCKGALIPSPTGRLYYYQQVWSDYERRLVAPYTQTRNYPIQGLATADLVLNVLGYIWRNLLPKYKGKVFLCGLIHDSLVFDVKKEVLVEFYREVSELMRSSGVLLNKVCPNLHWSLPVKVEATVGPNLGQMNDSLISSEVYT